MNYLKEVWKNFKWNLELNKAWKTNLFPPEEIQVILGLYEKYSADLLKVKQQQQEFFNKRTSVGLFPQLCDLEAEMTYLLIREYRPVTVLEISPASGWSTSWILHALKDNDQGTLYSYDLVESSIHIIPKWLSEGRWKFFQGDVTKNMALLPAKVDYFFIDSDHSAEFAHWYIDKLFPLYKKGIRISAHDILKWAHEPGWGEESLVLCSWLAKKGARCMTASRAMKKKGYNAITAARRKLGLDALIQTANYNSMIFFTLS
jgi:predicted O-methyltransferase YrrM